MEKYLEEKKSLSARVSESEAILTENEKNTADVDEFIRRLKKYAKDNYPRYVVTTDYLLQQRSGIRNVNLIDFICKNEKF